MNQQRGRSVGVGTRVLQGRGEALIQFGGERAADRNGTRGKPNAAKLPGAILFSRVRGAAAMLPSKRERRGSAPNLICAPRRRSDVAVRLPAGVTVDRTGGSAIFFVLS